jgi:hypothetical protein
MSGQLEVFKENLPIKPYATNDLSRGLSICHKKSAIQKRYLQHNPPAKIHWLVFDCDKSNALEVAIQQAHCPVPNLEVVNPANGHSHLFYGLAVPVVRTDLAHAKPLRYLASVEYALRQVLGGDFGYTGMISKNPLHASWTLIEHQPSLWTLGELSEFLTLPKKLPRKALTVGVGRNCALFEAVRRWAYAEVLAFRLTGNRESFAKAVYDVSQSLNAFPEPLPLSEVRGVAKSVARWTWNNYTGRNTDAEFSKRQAARAKQGRGVARYRHTARERAAIVEEARKPGAIATEVAKAHGVSKSALYRWLKESGNEA